MPNINNSAFQKGFAAARIITRPAHRPNSTPNPKWLASVNSVSNNTEGPQTGARPLSSQSSASSLSAWVGVTSPLKIPRAALSTQFYTSTGQSSSSTVSLTKAFPANNPHPTPPKKLVNPYLPKQDASASNSTGNANPNANPTPQRRLVNPYLPKQDTSASNSADNANPTPQRRLVNPYLPKQEASASNRADNANPTPPRRLTNPYLSKQEASASNPTQNQKTAPAQRPFFLPRTQPMQSFGLSGQSLNAAFVTPNQKTEPAPAQRPFFLPRAQVQATLSFGLSGQSLNAAFVTQNQIADPAQGPFFQPQALLKTDQYLPDPDYPSSNHASTSAQPTGHNQPISVNNSSPLKPILKSKSSMPSKYSVSSVSSLKSSASVKFDLNIKTLE